VLALVLAHLAVATLAGTLLGTVPEAGGAAWPAVVFAAGYAAPALAWVVAAAGGAGAAGEPRRGRR
jgi:hypothetical protein